tara:strand:+ start:434 stop:1087 length:654 start_codon:yes stop_codon:yes gene_type:complete
VSTLVVIQPSFLPWLGYFDLIDKSSVFVFYDHVQYDKNGWRNRNRIISNYSDWQWLTVPVNASLKSSIKDVKIENWEFSKKKIIKKLVQSYSKHPNFNETFNLINKIFGKNYSNISDLSIDLTIEICKKLEIKINFFRSSEYNNLKDKNENLIAWCKRVGCKSYLSGISAKNYIDKDLFKRNKIELIWHNYNHQKYKQFKNEDFLSNLSVIDYLFNR